MYFVFMIIEHLDDLPVLGAQICQVELAELINTCFADHGHWKGISGGKVIEGWLLYLLSEGDHRLSHVEEWAKLRLNTIASILEEPQLRSLDFCDDKLGRLLDRFSNDDKWYEFEQLMGRKILQVYQLDNSDSINIVRSDSFNAPQFRETGEIFRRGYSKQRRSDQPFCKVMISALDPIALPLAVDILKGSGTDTNHYLPIIRKIQNMLPGKGNLYVGDSQLGSMPNRLAIHVSGNYYLSPLNKKQVLKEELNRYIDEIKVPIKELPNIFTSLKSKRKAAYFYEKKEEIIDKEKGIKWEERRILVYSPDYAQGLIKSFSNRITEAEEKVKILMVRKSGRRISKTIKDLHERISVIIKKYKVEDCFDIECTEVVDKVRVKKYKNRPEEIREIITLQLSIKRKEELIAHKKKRLGWQLYGTNIPEDKMETSKLVITYRDEYKIEHLFDYLVNRDVKLLPIFLKKEERVKGLIRLLTLAMKFSVLIQHQVREQLKKAGKELKGIYPGNKGRKTSRPTTQMLLRVFQGIAIAWIPKGISHNVRITILNDKQKEVLELLKIKDAYRRILESLKTQPILRET